MVKITTAPNHNADTKRSIRLKHFFNSAFKSFSMEDNVRSIPDIDGLKDSQRKALYGTQTRGESAPKLTVERLAAHIASVTDYHHGVGSMEGTIAGMGCRLYPGSNNMELFDPWGQWGSRLTKKPGAGRYIESKLHSNFRVLFPKEDDDILEHNLVDGEKIGPKLYLPILPLVLINGGSGTGTGHACEIKSYHPDQVRDAVVKAIDGKPLKPGTLTPWFRTFKGTVVRNTETGQVIMTGTYEIKSPRQIIVTELPPGWFRDDYKAVLNDLMEPTRNRAGEVTAQPLVKDYEDNSSEDSFKFIINVVPAFTALPKETLLQKLKLVARDTENFTIFGADGVLRRHDSAESIINEFIKWRLPFYEVRRQRLITVTTESVRFNSELIRFIRFYIANAKNFSGTPKKQLIETMIENKFSDYDRLLGMPIWSLTKDRIDDLETKLAGQKAYLAELKSDTADAMYKRELKAFKYDETIYNNE